MSGVAIVRYLLAHHTPLTSQVPEARIKAGVLPLNTALPGISVTQISSTERLTVSMGESTHLVTERVQVSVLATTYPSQKALLTLVRAALPLSRGTVNSFTCDSILPDTEGPDIYSDNPVIFSQSQDFIVKFNR